MKNHTKAQLNTTGLMQCDYKEYVQVNGETGQT